MAYQWGGAMGNVVNPMLGGQGIGDWMNTRYSTPQGSPGMAVAPFRAGYGPGGLYYGGAAAGGAGGGGLTGWSGLGSPGQPSIADLLKLQQTENEWAKQAGLADWGEGKGLLYGAQRYNQDPMLTGARARAGELLANPEAINDQVMASIRSQALNALDAQMNARQRQMEGVLGESGRLDPSSMAALQERLDRTRQGALSNTISNLEVQRANQRNADYARAIGIGQGLGQQQYGMDMGVASTFLENRPRYVPQNFAGWAALLPQQSMTGMMGMGGMGGGGGGRKNAKERARWDAAAPSQWWGNTMGGAPIPGQPGMGAQGWSGMAGGAGPFYQGGGDTSYLPQSMYQLQNQGWGDTSYLPDYSSTYGAQGPVRSQSMYQLQNQGWGM